MLYTVGHAASYEQGLTEEGVLNKLGKGVDHQGRPYGGGCVFETKEAAQQYLRDGKYTGYKVYGLETNLSNTEQLEGEPHRRLLTNARIVRL